MGIKGRVPHCSPTRPARRYEEGEGGTNSNAAAAEGRSSVGRSGGEAEASEERTVPELQERAKELGLSGYSKSNKKELINSLRNH